MCDCPEVITCPRLKRSIILSTMKGLSPETRSVLKQMDPLTLIALKMLPPNIIKSNMEPTTNEDITTEEIDLGWKKSGEGFDAWEKENDVKLLPRNVSSTFKYWKLCSLLYIMRRTGKRSIWKLGVIFIVLTHHETHLGTTRMRKK